MLDTASIIRHLDGKVRQHMQGDLGGEARRSVSMLLSLLGGNEGDSVNSLAIGARTQDGASMSANGGGGGGASPGAGAGAGAGGGGGGGGGSPDGRLRTPDLEGLGDANVKRIGRGSPGMHGRPFTDPPSRPLHRPSVDRPHRPSRRRLPSPNLSPTTALPEPLTEPPH